MRSEVVDVHLVYEFSHACDHTHTRTHTHAHTASNRNKAITPRRMRDDKTITPLRMHFLGSVDVCVCVYYCRTYDKAVCGGGGGQ